MKKDLERWKEKMTPEEERRVWSKMQDSVRKGRSRRTSWPARPWLSRTVAAAAAVAIAVAVWQADLLEPEKAMDKTAGKETPSAALMDSAGREGPERARRGELAEMAAKPGLDAASQDVPKSEAPELTPGAGLAPEAEAGPQVEPAPKAEAEERTEPSPKSGAGQRIEPGPKAEAEPGGDWRVNLEDLKRQGTAGEEGAEKPATFADKPQVGADQDRARAEEESALLERAEAERAGQVPAESTGATPDTIDRGVMAVVPEDKRVYEGSEAARAETSAAGEIEASKQKPEAEGARSALDEMMAKSLADLEPPARADRRSDKQADASRGAARESILKPGGGGPGEVVGKVFDESGSPVERANVVVVGTGYGAASDDGGSFDIRDLPAGTYSVTVTHAGMKPLAVRDVEVRKHRRTDLGALVLKPSTAGQADTVYVEAKEAKEHESRFDEVMHSLSVSADNASKADGHFRERASRPARIVASAPYPRHQSLTGGTHPVNDELADGMYFRHYGANPFVDADEDALSTFALDVDTGSYTICRRYITERHLPPPEAVRVEEFVNFFRKDYMPPRRDDFRIYVDGMPSPFAHVQDGSYWLLRVGIKARVVDDRDRKPAQIVLVIDTSGSMSIETRLELLKRAMLIMVDELRPDDELGIVEYGSDARVVLPLTALYEKEDVRRAIRNLHPNGSTNAEAGLRLAYDMMRKGAREGHIHRLILCSDGVANVGRTGPDSILESVRRESDEIMLSTIGFGMGNYNDVLMEQLADAGDGRYAYVDTMKEAKRVLRENLTGTLQTIAKDTKAQVEFDPGAVRKYRLLGYENRDVRDEDFRNDEIDAGEIGAGHEVTALYEVKLNSKRPRGTMATVRLRYEDPETGSVYEMREPLGMEDCYREPEAAPVDLVVDACVAEFAEILRHSYWAKDGSLEDVHDMLRDATRGQRVGKDVEELIDLVGRAISIEEQSEEPGWSFPEEVPPGYRED